MSKNYVALYEGLKVYRDAMLGFVKTQLEAAYGDEWWERGVRRVFRDEDIDRLERNFERRFSGLPVVKRPGTERHEILDINYFNNIIQGNWKQAFAEPFGNDRGVLVWLKEITTLRNAIMHFETGDLSNDDTWRGLDTMQRVLSIVDPGAAEKLAHLKISVREVSTEPGFRPALREGSLDYEQGLTRLENAIVQQEGKEAETYLDLQGYRRQLITIFGERRLAPGLPDSQLGVRKERVLRELERLSTRFLSISFTDACAVSPPPFTAEDALNRIEKLKSEIGNLENQLYAKQCKKLAQQQTGEAVPKLDRDIERIQSQLAKKREKLTRLRETASPPAFFGVDREIQPSGTHPCIEEQPIHVSVEMKNLGREAVTVHYREGVPDSFEILEGDLELETEVAPSETVILLYTCYGTRPGRYRLFTEYIDYEGRASDWDEVEENIVEVRSGTEPQLVAARYYRYIEEGLELLVYIENKGDKIARDVEYKETIEVEGQSEGNIVTFEGDVAGGSSQTVEHLLRTSDPTKVRVPKSTEIVYNDSQERAKTLALKSDWKRIEYNFPLTPRDITTIGRDSEIQVISALIDQVWQLTHGQLRPGLKRLLFIRGIEGAGKTKLVYELLEQAQQRGFHCFVEDAKDRSPVKRMLRRLLGSRPDEDNDRLIWKQLEEQLPGEEHELQRQTVFRFISTTPVQFSEEEMDLLKANVLALVNRLCRQFPTLLVFENIHWTPEGAEEQLLSALLHNVLLSKDEPVLLCATYRPGEGDTLPVIGKLEMSRDYYEVLDLGAMDEEGVKAIVDQIVDFPRFSDPLYKFVCDWSHGNPLYLIELLRLLTNPNANYLTRVGSEWYPAYAVGLSKAVPKTVEEVILERVDLELPQKADFVKTLSAIGFELPLNLIEALATREFPEYSAHDLDRHLAALEEAGLLIVPEKEDRVMKVEGYEFEHQMKREVLYESLSQSKRFQLRQQVAEILLVEQIFPDPDEQLRQLARHLAKSPREFRAEHVEEIKKAATLERGLRNFSRSLEFYNTALDLVPEESFEAMYLIVERSRLQQMRGNLVPAEQDLGQVYRLVSPESPLAKQDVKRAKALRTLIEKEQGRLLLKQPQASLDRANKLLYRARIGLEGNLRLRRFFPPKSVEFHRDLVEIYLALVEVWLRKRKFKVCERACKRAERLAQNARTKLQDGSLLPRVYKALGDLHLERGIKREDYEEALTWYRLALESIEKDRYERERLWVALAETYRVLGDSAQARQHYEKAIEIQKQLGDVYGLALSFGGIGDLFVEQEEFEKGCYYCEQAYQYQRSVGDLNRFWRTCVSLTKIYLNDRNFEEAGKYWFQARDILFEQHRFDDLRIKKQREVYSLVCLLADHYRKDEQWDKWCACVQDRDYILPVISWEREELTRAQMELGEAYFKTRQWQDAIAAFTEALELADKPSTRAKIHEWLGDVYAVFESPTRTLVPERIEAGKAMDQTERHYEEAVKQLVRIGSIKSAVTVYEKLLEQIVTDEASLVQLPFTFLRILREIQPHQFQQCIHEWLVDKTEEVLLRNELPEEAGDIVVYTVREIARLDDSVIPFDKKLTYLRQAEALYREGNLEDLIWGLNMLIPTYCRLGLWDEVVHCFEELFELNIQAEDVDEFIETCRAIPTLSDKIETGRLERFIDLAVAGPQQVHFSPQQRTRLLLYAAKFHSHIADKLDEVEDVQRYHSLALEYYEEVRELATENTAMIAVVLHDSAVIYKYREEYDEALQRLSESIRIKECVGDYKSSAESRSIRAGLYVKREQFDEALSDYEQALKYLQRAGKYWNERLQYQDQQPLSPAEVVSMRYDRSWLASTYRRFAEFLIFRGELSRACDLAEQATYLCNTIGKPKAAKGAQAILAVSKLMSGAGSLPPGVSLKRGWPCPSCGTLLMEGIAKCPECGELLCPECGAAIEKEATQCPECGAEFTLVCPRCDAPLSLGEKACPTCGLELSKTCPECGGIVDMEQGRCLSCGLAICPACGEVVGGNDEVCSSCGTALALYCSECGAKVGGEDSVCPQCGEQFDAGYEESDEEGPERTI